MNHPPAPEDPTLESLVGQIAGEFTERLQRGERPDVEEYARRYPQVAGVLRQALTALRAVAPAGPPSAGPDGLADPGEPATGCLGDFRILREVGRGGMGVVYEAEQISLGRRVALKVLPFAAALDARQLQRFKNEAQAAAHLQHTNIVPVYYVGSERGVYFYAMQYIEGQTLAALIGELRHLAGPGRADAPPTAAYVPAPEPSRALPGAAPTPPAAVSTERSVRGPAFFRTAASLGVQAAEALEHAHQLGVIHRDVKPANLLVDAAGHLWVTDFGLAHCQSQAGLTMTGDLVGTLRYMSPEQALAKRVPVDHRTDIYSLGATLYELLTLEPAFPGRDRQELLRQIAFEEPRPPRRWNKAIPAELETILLKAMEKNPADRYATARELADDLGRYLKDEPIRARRPSLAQRARKWARRHRPVVVAAAASLAVVLLTAVIVLAVSNAQIKEEQRQTRQEQRKTAAALAREQQISYYHRIALAERESISNNVGRAQELLTECPERLRGWEWHFLRRLPYDPPRVLLRARGRRLWALAYSPDGRYLATTGVLSGEVKVWDAATGKELATLRGHAGTAGAVAFRPSGGQLASAGMDQKVILWDVATGKQVRTWHSRGPIVALAYRPDGNRLATGGADGAVRVWNLSAGQEVVSFAGQGSPVIGVAFSPDGQRLAWCDLAAHIHVWDARTGRPPRRLAGHGGLVFGLLFPKDGRHLVSAGADGWRLWDLHTGKETKAVQGMNSPTIAAAFSPDGERFATAGWDKTVKIWDWRTGQEVLVLRGHSDLVMALAFSGDGRRLVSAGLDGTVRLWNATPLADDPPGRRRLRGHRGLILWLAFSPDQRYLATASTDGTIKLWEVPSRKLVHTLPGRAGLVTSVAFHSGGKLLTAVTGDGTVVQWDPATGRRRRTWHELLAPIRPTGVGFSADGERFASMTRDGVRVWETASGDVIARLPATFPPPLLAFLSPDGKQVAVAGLGGVSLVGVKSRRTAKVLPGLSHMVQHLAFSADGRRLAAALWDGSVKVWDVKSGKALHTFRHSDRVMCVAFHPNGRQLASGSCDNTAKVWDLDTGREVATLSGHIGYVMAVAYRGDGKVLATASGNRYEGEVQFWDTAAFGKDR